MFLISRNSGNRNFGNNKKDRPLYHCGTGAVYAVPSLQRVVHFSELAGDRTGFGRAQRTGARGAQQGGGPGGAGALQPAHRAQAGPLYRICAGGLLVYAVPAGLHPPFCEVCELAAVCGAAGGGAGRNRAVVCAGAVFQREGCAD